MTQESRSLRATLLPRTVPTISGYDVAGGTATHEEGLGATLWGHFKLASGTQGCFLLHANPGAIPQGFYLGLGRALIAGLAPRYTTLADLMGDVNQTLSLGAPEAAGQSLECGMFVATEEGLTWSSAGNVPAGLIGRNGTFRELGSQGPPLGVMAGFAYRSVPVEVAVGDSVVALSRASGGLFKGTADLVAGLPGKPVGEVVSTIHRAIRQAHGDEAEVSVLYLRRG